jgi:outer membrane protein TolC
VIEVRIEMRAACAPARRQRMRAASPCAALWLALAPLTACAEPLDVVVRYALENHPRARAALAGAEAGGFLLEQSRAARFPQLALVADPGRLYSGAQGGSEEIGDLSLRGSVLLYDGGRTRETIARERDRLAAADAGLQLTSEDLAARVAEVYLEWLRQQQLAKIAADNVAAHESLYERVREIASFDRGRASDLLQVGARLEQARLARAVREGAAAEARAVLSAVVGREVVSVELPRDPLPAEPGSRAAALALLDTHPAVRAAEAEASASGRAARLAAAWSRPRIDLVASLESPTDLTGDRRYFEDQALRLAATWAPVDGGAGRAGARAAERQALQAREAAQALRRDLETRVAGLWTQLEQRRQRLQSYRTLAEQTLQVREAYWQQFTIARRSIIDLLNAEREYFDARLAAEDAGLEVLLTQYRLLAGCATLNAWLGGSTAVREQP